MCLALLVCALTMPGCAPWRLPRIDPSGQRVFVPGESYRPLAGLRSQAPPPFVSPTVEGALVPPFAAPPPFVGARPVGPALVNPPPVAGPRISVSPGLVVSPIGSQVIVVADVPGRGGFFSGSQRVEWTLAPGGVGQLAGVGRGNWLDLWRPAGSVPGGGVPGGSVFGSYAIGSTSASAMRINRGTPLTADDVMIQSGQAWVAVSSLIEGTSHVTAFAPSMSNINGRQASATIHWIDAQWVFPPPAVNPIGRQHTFTTTVSRQSDGSPIVGWFVRYEITSGPPAGFAPDGAQVVEVATDGLGQASVDISQTTAGEARPVPGTSQIDIQIIREPVEAGGERLLLGRGTTTRTWSAPNIELRTSGPDIPAPDVPGPAVPTREIQAPETPAPVGPKLDVKITGPKTAEVGQTVEFTAVVTNRGDTPASGLTITDRFEAGLEHATSETPIEADLDDIAPGENRTFSITFTVTRVGQACHVVEVTGEGGVRVSSQACLTATEPQPLAHPGLEVIKTGPKQVHAGDTAAFFVDIRNTGNVPLTNLQIADSFPPGLEPINATDGFTAHQGELVWTIARLEPGQTRRLQVNCECTIVRTRACNQVIVTCDQRPPIADETCVEVLPALRPLGPPVQEEPPTRDPPVSTEGATGETTDTQSEPDDTAAAGPDTDPEQVGDDPITGDPTTDDPVADLASPDVVQETPPVPSDLRLSIAELGDPVGVGDLVSYQLIIENKGQLPDQEVVLTVTFGESLVPGQIETPGETTWTVETSTITFESIAEIRAGETLTYRIPFKAHTAGDTSIVAELTSGRLPQPLRVEEKTEIVER